ncbi:MAG TPA: hypothetical protein VKV22_06260 [Rhodanobacteraceae bacterium]|nr:hypothetical protein [Rhodanobacteraceae bacterium]
MATVPCFIPSMRSAGANFSPGPWRVAKSRRKGWSYEVRDRHGDRVAVVYGGKIDADLAASAPELRACVERLLAIASRFEPQLSSADTRTLGAVRVLVAAR